jgi:hypothetical protein
MSTLDHFESAFRSAAKVGFGWKPPHIRKIIVVTDLDREAADRFAARVREFLAGALAQTESDGQPSWRVISGAEYSDVAGLLALVEAEDADLLCTYRQLHSDASGFRYSLGEYIHVLTQATTIPVLLTPHPSSEAAASHALHDTDVVMAMTDHLTGSDRLVNYAVAMTQASGKLWLTHVEDELAYDRIMAAIAKIPQIETDLARELIRDKLLAQPLDYVQVCAKIIAEHQPGLPIKPLVIMGHHLETYRQLVGDHQVDLLVMNTKDEDQLAMHGMAYPIAVEIRDIPLLLL